MADYYNNNTSYAGGYTEKEKAWLTILRYGGFLLFGAGNLWFCEQEAARRGERCRAGARRRLHDRECLDNADGHRASQDYERKAETEEKVLIPPHST